MPPRQITASNRPELDTSVPSDISSQETILCTAEDIEALLERSRHLFSPLRVQKISVSVEGLSPRASEEIETRLKAYLSDCGCQAGSVAAAIGIFVYLALLTAVVGWPSAWKWKHLFIGIGVCFGMAMLGKLFGLLRARVKLVRELELLCEVCRNGKGCRTGG